METQQPFRRTPASGQKTVWPACRGRVDDVDHQHGEITKPFQVSKLEPSIEAGHTGVGLYGEGPRECAQALRA